MTHLEKMVAKRAANRKRPADALCVCGHTWEYHDGAPISKEEIRDLWVLKWPESTEENVPDCCVPSCECDGWLPMPRENASIEIKQPEVG